MLQGVTRSVLRCDDRFTKRKLVAIGQFFMIEAIARIALMADEYFRGTKPGTEFPGTTDEIRVDVRIEDMGDGNLFLPRQS